jgi:hypothetical protein
MTSKLVIENIDEASRKLTDAVIKHFTDKIAGHGYFYKDQDWAIERIVKKHLEGLTIAEEKIYVVNIGEGMNAKPGATGVLVPEKNYGEYIHIVWNRDNPLCFLQQDGAYYPNGFKIIDRETYDKLNSGVKAAFNTITELVKNVS